MLKRLQLVGFKSFADKTDFDFGDGITAIVGPNGSGKSNIVDALRWILGEQSAKSLRGGEMADVIFNGSTARRSLGLAEVTMTFDNRKRQLATDAEEVQITRRVYRSGEGEYLINGQPSRLRDIKDLFLGSGAGHDAYCIIEQGKVDVLLQASTKERRALFEETAGISRFKAKKLETLRKLEKVDQNLQRLRDIVDEVEKQLRSVKMQATKAQRYHEFSNRLKELRLQLGLGEYHQLNEKYAAENKVLEELAIELDQRAGKAGACEAEAERLEMLLADLDDQLHQDEGLLAEVVQRIRTEEAAIVHEGNLTTDLDKELDRTRRRLSELAERVAGLAESTALAQAEFAETQTQADQQRQQVQALEQHLAKTAQQFQALNEQIAADKTEHLEQMRHSAHLQNDVVSCKAQVDNLSREKIRLTNKSSLAAESLAAVDLELRELGEGDQVLQERLMKVRQEQTEKRQEAERLRLLRDRTGEQLSVLREQRSGLASRIEVLQRMSDTHEGLGTGVREMLEILEKGEDAGSRSRQTSGDAADTGELAAEANPNNSRSRQTSGDAADAGELASAAEANPNGSRSRQTSGDAADTGTLASSATNLASSATNLASSVNSPSLALQVGVNTESAANPWSTVLGMVVDFLSVKREWAPLIDLALGDWAQRFLVRDIQELLQAVAQKPVPFSGRIGFLPLKSEFASSESTPAYAALRGNRLVEVAVLSRVRRPPRSETPTHPGLVAPAEQVVSCDHPDLTALPGQLLGRTLIVRDLAVAEAIAAHTPGFRLITLQGEMLEPDGTLTIGTHHAETGILSHRSELFELNEQVEQLDTRLAHIEQDLQQLREMGERLDVALAEKQQEMDALAEQAGDLRNRLQRHRERRQSLHDEVTLNKEEIQRLEEEIVGLEATWHEAQTRVADAEAQVQQLHARVHQAEENLRLLEHERQERQRNLTLGQVAQAKTDERLEGLRAKHQQLARDLGQRQREQQQGQQVVASSRERRLASQKAQLQSSANLAQLYLDKEAAQRRLAELLAQRDARRQDRGRLAQQAQTVRNEWRTLQEHAHNCELKAKDLHHQRQSLIQRLQEDYQIDLAELHRRWLAQRASRVSGGSEPKTQVAVKEQAAEGAKHSQKNETAATQPVVAAIVAEQTPPADAGGSLADAGGSLSVEGSLEVHVSPEDRVLNSQSLIDVQAANEEIADLRHKLSRLGSVNVESLQELQELETRAGELGAQWQDLTSAKKSLEEIIAKINQDSRKLFSDTFATIRTHFQELFRKMFGGGQADIVLEDEVDILESGIEVIARPPGKELRSISLMSGGEKTMTAVALLLAVFRSKPSPFCLLDEVDAALDEANIGRFTDVLRDFLDKSQFIIITHSKKTMACADVLYGITMQESGISKQVAVRFEDWVEEEPVAAAPHGPTGNGNGKPESFAGR